MAWDKLDYNITNREVLHPEQEHVKKQDAKPKVVPVVNENPSQPADLEQPVEGYYIEKTPQELEKKPDDKDNDIDTGVYPNARISILPSIAINNTTNEITNAMENAVNRAATELFEKSSNNSYIKAQSLIQNNQLHQCFDELNYPKRLNIYGKVVYEGTNQKYLNNVPASESTYTLQSERADLGINWKSKSGNTKAFVFGSYAHTKMNLDMELKSNSEKVLSDSEHDNSFSVYGAAEHRFKKGDLLMGSASYINDPVEASKMTTIDAGYYLSKFMVLAEGKTTIFQLLDAKTVTKTDFSISLNPELAFDLPKAENTSETEATPEKEKVLAPNAKKWSTALSPFFDTQSIAGNTENGLGLKVRLNRTDDNSNFKFATFGKVSTTQQEESSKYHVTFGSGIKYAKNIGAKSLLKAEAEVKNRYTFGNDNILTASAHTLYTSPKISLEAEAKRILISDEQHSYAAIVGRAYYTPTKNFNLYTEASYTNYKDTSSELKGTNVQAGVIVNF